MYYNRLILFFPALFAAMAALAAPAAGVPGASDALLEPAFWIAKLEHPDEVALTPGEIRKQNARLERLDDTVYDLPALPASLERQQVRHWIEDLASEPTRTLYDVAGQPLARKTLAGISANRNIEAIPAVQRARYGLVVRRADLRTFPTLQRVFRSAGDSDIDRFQESALFPGTPVVMLHESRDGLWWFVVSPRYAAWVEKQYVAEGNADTVFAYAKKTPYRVVTGATVDTVFTPEQTAMSQLQLDMGVRLPLRDAASLDQAINGQFPYSAHVIELPLRAADGTLRIAPALLQKTTDTSADYLPLTRANVIRQGFKFLGERYGWGHSYNARDCSGFVSEIYRSMGVQMPRNTSAQAVSPALHKQLFDGDDGSDVRTQAVAALAVGDLVYIPGHVMMVIGRIDGEPWVIHDTTGISYKTASGEMARVPLNAVSVTPFLPLQFNEEQTFTDRMTSIVKIVPEPAKDTSSPL